MLLSRTALFASPLGEQLMFYSMRGQETLGRLFSYEVELLSPDDSIDLSKLLGQAATVGVELSDGGVREFTGFVTEFALVGEHGNYARYRATLRPWLWFLGQNRECRIFQRQSVPEIVKDLLRERGFSDVEDALHGHYEPWEFLVQYRESDLNFISRILEQAGIYYFFKHAQGKHTLVLADSANAHQTSPGYEHVPYYTPSEREMRQQEHVDTWILSRQIRQGHVALRDFNFTYPTPFQGEKSAPFPDPGASLELYDYPAQINVKSADEASPATEALAEIRLEEHQADYETVRAGGPLRGLMAGNKFTLTQYPREDQNKQHLIVSARYEIRVAEYESNIIEDKDPTFRFELSAIDAKRPYRAPRITRKPVVEGPQTAIVVGDPAQEIWTDEYGRVQVQFHWDRKGQRDQDSSCFVRVAQAWAGTGWGSMHIPRIGQEVIVDFLEGDPDRPIITGRVYNADNPAPYPQTPTQSGIKSRSTPGGGENNFNELRFEDKKGEEELHMRAEKDMSTLVKHDRTATILRNDTLNIQGDQFIHIHGNLSMTVDGVTDNDNPDKGKPIKSSMGITGAHDMKASDSITFSAPNKITISVPGSSITLTPGGITISAGGGASISLDSVLIAAAAGKAQLKLDDKVLAKSAAGSELQLDPKIHLHASLGADILMDPNILAKSDGGSQVLIDANAVLLDAKTVKATGSADASIVSGPASMKCSAAGAEVNSPNTNVKGGTMVNISGPLVKIN
jgi:type VI secretion system secreted protein VgrG